MVYQFMLYAKSRVQLAEELVLDDEMGTHGLEPVALMKRTTHCSHDCELLRQRSND